MKTGLVNYRISKHGTDRGVVVKRARVAHICEECTAPITPKTVYIEHPVKFGSPSKFHVKCAVTLELAEPIPSVDVHGDAPERFTPGPWNVDSVDGGFVFADKTSQRIADCYCDEQPDMANWRIEANARLIAAAPDMIAALKGLTRWLRAHAEHEDEFFVQSMAQADAAIQKAL